MLKNNLLVVNVLKPKATGLSNSFDYINDNFYDGILACCDIQKNSVNVQKELFDIRKTTFSDFVSIIKLFKRENSIKSLLIVVHNYDEVAIKDSYIIRLMSLIKEEMSCETGSIEGVGELFILFPEQYLKKFTNSYPHVVEFNTFDIQLKGFEIKDPSLNIFRSKELFIKKLIKRIGYFPRDPFSPSHERFDRYFYDASYCTNELIDLIDWYIENKLPKTSKKLYILYDNKIEGWLDNIVSYCSYQGSFTISVMDIEFAVSEKKIKNAQKTDHFLCLYPMVNTSKTIKRQISALMKEESKFDINKNVSVLSILKSLPSFVNSDTASSQTIYSSRVEIPNVGDIKLDYFFNVDKGMIDKNECESMKIAMRQVGIMPPQDYRYLLAHEFWHLIDQSGLIEEEDVPEHRKETVKILDHVPDTFAIFDNFGVYLCEKLIENIKRKLKNELAEYEEYLVVTPDEKHINKIVESFEIVSNFKVISIARNRIDSEDDEWLQGLLIDHQYNESVIVLDEFTKSGKTINKLSGMLERLGKTVIDKTVIFSFLPTESSEDITSLYSLPLNFKM